MLKLLKTRFFANAFNNYVDKLAEKLGRSGDVFAILLFPILSGLVWWAFFVFVWIFHPMLEETASYNFLVSVAYEMVWLLSIALSAFVIRLAAKKYSAKTFIMFMSFPIIVGACLFLTDNTSFNNEPYWLGIVWLLLETLAILAVLFYKPYSNYRAFQIVGSLALILFATCLFYGNLIISCAVYVFWMLSTAHILFRDKLLDCLEKK